MRLANDSPSFTPVHSQIRAIGPRDLHLAKGRGRCRESDLALSLELAADLPVQGLLVGFNGQQEVGPLLQAPAKNACVVCSASA